jgi:ribosomal protein L30/L7E
MVANGLTKLLPRQKHASFVKLLRMVEIEHLVIKE